MAKDKGKSKRRIRHWRQRYLSGEQLDESQKQPLSRRAVKLPPQRLAEPAKNLDDLPKADGVVMGLFPGGAIVRCGGDELLCGIAGTFRAPADASALAVGDNVTIALARSARADSAAEADKDRADGMILTRAPRQSALARPRPQSGKRPGRYADEPFDKIIVANVDVLLIIASSREPPLRRGMIERFLIIAERGELAPILVINKIDLARPDKEILADCDALGVQIHLTSAVQGEGLDELAMALKDKRSVLAGASGVGKSTLINALVPGANVATRTVRRKDRRGRHVTSAAAMYDLPGGGVLVDTPGIRQLGINLTPAELPWYFPEFEQLAGQCKFNDCTHTHEADCAVLAAVEADEIPRRRYESYLRILDTLGDRYA